MIFLTRILSSLLGNVRFVSENISVSLSSARPAPLSPLPAFPFAFREQRPLACLPLASLIQECAFGLRSGCISDGNAATHWVKRTFLRKGRRFGYKVLAASTKASSRPSAGQGSKEAGQQGSMGREGLVGSLGCEGPGLRAPANRA